MRTSIFSALVTTLSLIGCDDTAQAIREESHEERREEQREEAAERQSQKSEAEVRDADDRAEDTVERVGDDIERGVKNAAVETGRVIDKVDKKVAKEIRD